MAQGHDYLGFYQREIAARRENQYPPFAELANLVFSDADDDKAMGTARRAAVCLQGMGVFHKKGDVQFLGPARAPLHKLRRRYRYQMLLKAPDTASLHQTVRGLLEVLGDTSSTQIVCDIDPVDMM